MASAVPRRAPAVPLLRAPKRTPPLSVLLQKLSNLALRIRLNYHTLHAPILADSVRLHLLSPLQEYVLNGSPSARDEPALAFPYEYHHTTQVVHVLLTSFLPQPPSRTQFLHLSAVYDALYDALHDYEPKSHTFTVLLAIWTDVIAILARQLNLWLAQTLQPELLRDFFIDVAVNPPVVIASALPSFIPPEVANMILFAGTAAKCSLILTTDSTKSMWSLHSPKSNSSTSPITTTSRPSPTSSASPTAKGSVSTELLSLRADAAVARVKERPLSSQLILQAAATQWRNVAANHLSNLLPFSDIASRLQHLRDYLLHGNPLFWHLFFERLRATPLNLPTGNTRTTGNRGVILSPEDRVDVERALNHLLVTVSTDLHHAVDASISPDAPFSLVVAPSATLQPRFALSFHETPVLASRASVYCDLFSLTFALRRAVTEVRAAFAHLLQLHRGDIATVTVSATATRRRESPGEQRRAAGSRSGRAHDETGGARRRKWTMAERREIRRALSRPIELRRRMGVFLEAMEWYVQAEVIEPKFVQLRNRLDQQGREACGDFFDEFYTMHEHALDTIVAQCFLNDALVQGRLNAIFAACVAFADFVRGVGDSVGEEEEVDECCEVVGKEFERQVDLLVQMLMHSQKGIGESKVHALLLRLNMNGFEVF